MKKSILRLLLLTLIVGQTLFADWPCQTTQYVNVSSNPGIQWNPRSSTDGKGGAIVVWQDRRGGAIDKVYAQRLNNFGNPVWQNGGIPLSLSAAYQVFPQVVGDGTGGAFVTWMENRNGIDYDVYVQRVTSNGLTMWSPGGNVVSAAADNQYYPMIIKDQGGQDGVIVVWEDRRNGDYDVYAQKYDGSGNEMWSDGGEVVIQMNGDQVNPVVVSDGQGGAVITWSDYRTEAGTADVYCQRILADGRLAWVPDGVPVVTATNDQLSPQIVTDGTQGAIIAWQDRRDASIDKIYMQRVDKDGNARWQQDGVVMAYSAGIQASPKLASDGMGGAIVVWQDNRSGDDYDIFAQYVNSSGTRLWSQEGLPICVMGGQQYNPTLVLEGTSVLIMWQDKRNQVDFDIYGQRVNLFGVALWTPNGNPVHTAPFDQVGPQLVTDQQRGGIVVWTDYRIGGGATDLFGQRIGSNGKMAGGCYRSFTQDSLSQLSTRVRTPIPGTRIQRLHMPNSGNIRDSVWKHGAFQDGLIIGVGQPISARNFGWIWISVPLNVRRALPMRGTPRPFQFISNRDFNGVLRNPSYIRYTNALVGEQMALKHNIAASDEHITDPGFGDLVYRDPGGRPNAFTNRTLRSIMMLVDSSLTYYQDYYWVNYMQFDTTLNAINRAFSARIDTVSLNPLHLKPAKALFSVPYLVANADTAPLPPAPVYTQLASSNDDDNTDGTLPFQYDMGQNYPNPFNPTTNIDFSLTEQGTVSLRIFNTLGQEVANLLNNVQMDPGSQTVMFDASKLSSGVYFYQLVIKRVMPAGQDDLVPHVIVKKMILMR